MAARLCPKGVKLEIGGCGPGDWDGQCDEGLRTNEPVELELESEYLDARTSGF